ncbi:phosphatidyl-N-methylethanolamine N- methyltransferase [Schizosaccharomyces japonicus yFS275]|uniref:Phosphatidyl-N-methylethanolamine N-methyltransferase n=1 Tax=Schizosaccharomyces japonicus (strain yFS275 / FY16936) TaxID=402676 RepID=B6JWN5_SCHJY|nr:phosphatidyl-N-methylethanolamine N- methyltransferase [Schizosaccharomyces japonicus yFS275]EEB05786.2 phosphatidyl-N-methylethanolamine N- methyltransferase [Schizosaccharomyces japonicus yFS275]
MFFIEFKKSLLAAVLSIFLNPLLWNLAARQEYHNKTLTKLANGDSKKACYGLAIVIFVGGIIRDLIFQNAIKRQPTMSLLLAPFFQGISKLLLLAGSVLVLSSMYRLGIVNTYLGDYFGFLLPARLTGFPFNVCDNPMYVGSTLCFLATALRYGKPVGFLLTAEVYYVYKLALKYEEPFTAKIYANKDAKKN